MKYIDSGTRDETQAVAYWLQSALNADVVELRWQSGFFDYDGIGVFVPTVERLIKDGRAIRALIGSNDSGTLRDDVGRLISLLGLPGSSAQLGIVSFGGAFFHPKVYHLTRSDSSQTAYVGSANLTAAGLSSLHVEAGVILDTRDGDSQAHLSQIASAIDGWFKNKPDGFTLVTDTNVVDQLVSNGVLAVAPLPRAVAPAVSAGSAIRSPRPRLKPLVKLPRPAPAAAPVPAQPVSTATPSLVSVPRRGFPAYVLFDPTASTPTVGTLALSGAPLPGAAVGLVVRLNRDSARHFEGRGGTANISIPVATVGTFRFGIFKGKYARPRLEIDLAIRYIGDSYLLQIQPTSTNIMAYGFAPGESGHGDIRMVVPASVRSLAEDVKKAHHKAPGDGDFAFLEWPTIEGPTFKLTFLDPASRLYSDAAASFSTARAARQLVGGGACWLPSGMSPVW